MSYSHNLGMSVSMMPQINGQLSVRPTTTATTTMSASAAAPRPSGAAAAAANWPYEQGLLTALRDVLWPVYVTDLVKSATAPGLSMGERNTLASRAQVARRTRTALAAVRPHANGWTATQAAKIATIDRAGEMPTETEVLVLAKVNPQAASRARKIASVWQQLRSSLVASGWWPQAPSLVPRTDHSMTILQPDKPTAPPPTASAEDEARLREARAREEEAKAEAELLRAFAAEARAAAEAATEAGAAVAREAQERAMAAQEAMAQAEERAAVAAAAMEEELIRQKKKGHLWLWVLGALAVGGVGYAVLKK